MDEVISTTFDNSTEGLENTNSSNAIFNSTVTQLKPSISADSAASHTLLVWIIAVMRLAACAN